MHTYILSKLLHAVGVTLVISMVSFFLLFVSADPASMLLPEEADDEDIARFEAELGLDRPVVVQYLDFLGRVVLHGDFGDSYISKLPASKMIAETMWSTVKLAVAAMLFATLVAVPVGVYASIRRYSVTDPPQPGRHANVSQSGHQGKPEGLSGQFPADGQAAPGRQNYRHWELHLGQL